MDTSRRGFLRLLGAATAAGASAPVIAQLDHLVRQPHSIIKPDMDIIANPNTVSFQVNGLVPGDRVYVMREDTGEVLYNDIPGKPYQELAIQMPDGSHDDMVDAMRFAVDQLRPERNRFSFEDGERGLSPVKAEGERIPYDNALFESPGVPLLVRVRNGSKPYLPFQQEVSVDGGMNVITAQRVPDPVRVMGHDNKQDQLIRNPEDRARRFDDRSDLAIKTKRNGQTVLVPGWWTRK